MIDHVDCVRRAVGYMADGINLKRRSRNATSLKAAPAADTALTWLSDNTDAFVNATPQGASATARLDPVTDPTLPYLG